MLHFNGDIDGLVKNFRLPGLSGQVGFFGFFREVRRRRNTVAGCFGYGIRGHLFGRGIRLRRDGNRLCFQIRIRLLR